MRIENEKVKVDVDKAIEEYNEKLPYLVIEAGTSIGEMRRRSANFLTENIIEYGNKEMYVSVAGKRYFVRVVEMVEEVHPDFTVDVINSILHFLEGDKTGVESERMSFLEGVRAFGKKVKDRISESVAEKSGSTPLPVAPAYKSTKDKVEKEKIENQSSYINEEKKGLEKEDSLSKVLETDEWSELTRALDKKDE